MSTSSYLAGHWILMLKTAAMLQSLRSASRRYHSSRRWMANRKTGTQAESRQTVKRRPPTEMRRGVAGDEQLDPMLATSWTWNETEKKNADFAEAVPYWCWVLLDHRRRPPSRVLNPKQSSDVADQWMLAWHHLGMNVGHCLCDQTVLHPDVPTRISWNDENYWRTSHDWPAAAVPPWVDPGTACRRQWQWPMRGHLPSSDCDERHVVVVYDWWVSAACQCRRITPLLAPPHCCWGRWDDSNCHATYASEHPPPDHG